MKKVSLSGSLRENVGKKDTKALRRAGLVPAVIYGGENQVHIALKELEIGKLVFTREVFQINLSVGETTYQVVIKDMQFHPLTDAILHIDFQETVEDKPLKIKLPVRVTGNSIGIRNGGRLMLPFRRLTLKGYPSALPEAIEIDITDLRIGGKIRVSDLDLKDFSIMEPADTVVVLIRTSRNILEDEEEEGEEGEEGTEEGAEEGGETPAEG